MDSKFVILLFLVFMADRTVVNSQSQTTVRLWCYDTLAPAFMYGTFSNKLDLCWTALSLLRRGPVRAVVYSFSVITGEPKLNKLCSYWIILSVLIYSL